MLAIVFGALWDLISFNDFQIPRAAWHLLQSASA